MSSSAQSDPDEQLPDPVSAVSSGVTASWEVLAAYVERFLAAWELDSGTPLPADFLPDGDRVLRRMVLTELIKVDLEYRHRSGIAVLQLEDYAAENRELDGPDGIPADLIFEEYHVRKANGETPDANEYLDRFPQHANALAQLLDFDAPTSGSSLSGVRVHDTFEPGHRIDDFYLMSKLGTGAFGSVYLARQESMQRLVALKISRDRGTEAMTLAQLDHPHIVRVHDQHRIPDRNLRLLYMQFAAGGTLHSVIERAKSTENRTGDLVGESIAAALNTTGVISADDVPLRPELAGRPWSEVTCRLGMELATALSYAHSQGILHRDVKPANVLLDASGSAKLADFNISFSENLNACGAAAYFGGSLAYMSPEQLEACHPGHARRAEELDGRSDIFSLGVLLWELMFGTRPFDDEAVSGGWSDSIERMTSIRRAGPCDPPKAPSDDTGRELLQILRKCLAPDPDDRFATAHELAGNLGLCLQPRVATLLRKHDSGISGMAVRHPLIALVLATMVPNLLSARFNYVYNFRAIIGQLDDKARHTFNLLEQTIDSIAFPTGLAGTFVFAFPVLYALIRRRNVTPERRTFARRRSLYLGTFAAGLGITLWLVAGLAYPIGLHMSLGQFPAREYVHFFGSMLICGMIAAAYPFFLLLWLAVRGFFPALLRGQSLTPADTAALTSVNGQTRWLLFVAGSVPALGTLMLLATSDLDETHNRLALTVLSAVGAIGFAVAFALYRILQDDIAALQEAAQLVGGTKERQ